MMHIFLHHFHGILLLSHKPLISHVKYITAVAFVSAIFVLFFLRTHKQPDSQETEGRLKCASTWECPMSTPLPDSWWLLKSEELHQDFWWNWEKDPPKAQQLFVCDVFHAITWVRGQLRKPSQKIRNAKTPWKPLVSVASCCFFAARFMHFALATGLLGLLVCAGFAFFTLPCSCRGASTPVKLKRGAVI